MSDDRKPKKNPIISTRTSEDIQRQIDDEAELRGHTRSQALEQIIKLGFPRYLKRFPRKFERVDSAA